MPEWRVVQFPDGRVAEPGDPRSLYGDLRYRDGPAVPRRRTAVDDSRTRAKRTCATAKLLRARSSDDADRASAHWKAPLLPDTVFYRNFIRSVQRSRVVWRGEDRGGGVRFANGSTPQIALDKEQATAVYGTTGSNQHQESHHTSCRFRGLRSCLSDPIPEVSWASSLRHTPTRNTIAVALQYSRTPKSSH